MCAVLCVRVVYTVPLYELRANFQPYRHGLHRFYRFALKKKKKNDTKYNNKNINNDGSQEHRRNYTSKDLRNFRFYYVSQRQLYAGASYGDNNGLVHCWYYRAETVYHRQPEPCQAGLPGRRPPSPRTRFPNDVFMYIIQLLN